MVELDLEDAELAILLNCINETLEAIEDRELHPRTGADRGALLALQSKIQIAYEAARSG